MGDDRVLLAFAPVAGLIAYGISHVPFCWMLRRSNYLLPLVIGFFVGLIATLTITAFAVHHQDDKVADSVALLALNSLTYLGLGWCYFNLVNINFASLRIRMLKEIADAGGTMSRTELLAEYNTGQVIARRMQRLLHWENLEEREGRYYIGRKKWFLLVARFYDMCHWIVFGSPDASRSHDD